MNGVLTKYEKQELGSIISANGSSPDEYIYTEVLETENTYGSATLTNRESSDFFTVQDGAQYYNVTTSVPGMDKSVDTSGLGWDGVRNSLAEWVVRVRREIEAVDPWEQEAKDMADDDSYFTISELPRVDRAIGESLEQLKELALEHGVALERVEGELRDVRSVLEKTARNSTKREWITLFKSIVVDKLVDWGMQTVMFQTILHTLVTSAHDIVWLAEHASRHLT